MGKKEEKKPIQAEVKVRSKSKKIHIEIPPLSWKNITAKVDAYNDDPNRVTPAIKADHVINDALNRYLSEIEKK